MRGLWDHEQPLSPGLLRSAMALAGGFLALIAVVVLVAAIINVIDGFYIPAALQAAVGIALPFTIWLWLKMMADVLVALNRSHDRLEAIEEHFTGTAASAQAYVPPNGAAADRAGDDGPTYPAEE